MPHSETHVGGGGGGGGLGGGLGPGGGDGGGDGGGGLSGTPHSSAEQQLAKQFTAM